MFTTGKEIQAALLLAPMQTKCNVCGEVHLIHSPGWSGGANLGVWPCVEARLYSAMQLVHGKIPLSRLYDAAAMCLVAATVPPGDMLEGFFRKNPQEQEVAHLVACASSVLIVGIHVGLAKPAYVRPPNHVSGASVIVPLSDMATALLCLAKVTKESSFSTLHANYGAWLFPYPGSLEWGLALDPESADREIASQYLTTLLSPQAWSEFEETIGPLQIDGGGFPSLRGLAGNLCALACDLRNEAKNEGLWDSQLFSG